MGDRSFNLAFGEFLRKRRKELGLRQIDVADKAEISDSYYQYIETGQRNVDLELAITLCKILNLNMGDFIMEQVPLNGQTETVVAATEN